MKIFSRILAACAVLAGSVFGDSTRMLMRAERERGRRPYGNGGHGGTTRATPGAHRVPTTGNAWYFDYASRSHGPKRAIQNCKRYV